MSQPPQSFLRRWLGSFFTPAGRQASRNLGWLLAAAIVTQICGLLSVLLLTKSLGAELYGVLAFGLTLQGYLMILGTAGLRAVIVRELTRRPEAQTTCNSNVCSPQSAERFGAPREFSHDDRS